MLLLNNQHASRLTSCYDTHRLPLQKKITFQQPNFLRTLDKPQPEWRISDWQNWFLGSRRPRGDYPPTTTRACGDCGIIKPFVVQKKATADCLTGLPSRQRQQKLTTLSPIDERGDAVRIKRRCACRWLHSQLLLKPCRAPRQHTAGKTSSSSWLYQGWVDEWLEWC